MESITSNKVIKLIMLIDRLTDVASIDPQIALCCLTKWKWSHLSRTSCRSSLLEPLCESTGDRFVPTMLQRDAPWCMFDLLSSSIRYNGLGIERPYYTEHQFEWSKMLCESYHTDVTGDILRTERNLKKYSNYLRSPLCRADGMYFKKYSWLYCKYN
ncbi:hypothetical protein GJ496_002056 [Pomphorhynchus laevis]|nr:hypothetical protein GJ496_002056 [Pomphorhynchus laevis]